MFDEHSKTLVVDLWLPGLADVPNVVEHRYVVSRKTVKAIEMKQKDFEALYDSVIHQLALKTMRDLFVSDYSKQVQAVVFNGWVKGINGKTGKEFTSCILSCEALAMASRRSI